MTAPPPEAAAHHGAPSVAQIVDDLTYAFEGTFTGEEVHRAAALAAHLAPGRVHVRAAGSAPTGDINPVVVQALAERGITLREAFPKPLSDLLRDLDL